MYALYVPVSLGNTNLSRHKICGLNLLLNFFKQSGDVYSAEDIL